MSRFLRHIIPLCCVASSALAARPLAAQPPSAITRDAAVQTALRQAAALGVARADTAVAYAQLLAARAWQNPTLSASYTKSEPRYHYTADLPIDYPGVRGARVRAAQAGRAVSRLRFASARTLVALTVDTAYTRALAARERLRLSTRNAIGADSLRLIAARRRDAGDVSDLDVELATVNAAQQVNTTLTDSLAFVSAVLDLQAAIGVPADGVAIVPIDSLGVPPAPPASSAADLVSPGAAGVATGLGVTTPATTAPLAVAAAQASVEATRLAALAERRNVWTTPSVTAGFETGDAATPGLLPTVGISLPFPLINRNRGAIAQAEAERGRAQAELTLAQVESRTEITRARRALGIALDKMRRDQALVASANRVAALSATAYREGALPLPNVLEAQRNAREALAQYVADVADAWITTATLRALTLTSFSADSSR